MGDVYALLTAVCWSVAIILFRISGFHFKPIPFKVFQNFWALVLFFFCLLLFDTLRLPDFDSTQWLLLVSSAVLGVTFGDTLHVASLNRVGAGLQAILDCLYVPIVMIFAYFFFQERLSAGELIGGLLVIVGIVIGSSSGALPGTSKKELSVGIFFGILTQFAHAGTVLMVKDLVDFESVLLVTFWRFLIGLSLMVFWLMIKGQASQIMEAFVGDSRLKVTVAGTLLGPFASTLFWFLSFKYTLAGRAAIYNQMASIFIIVLAALWLKEPLKKRTWLAVFIAVIGGILVKLV